MGYEDFVKEEYIDIQRIFYMIFCIYETSDSDLIFVYDDN